MTTEEILKKLSEHFRDAEFQLVEGAKIPVTGAPAGDPCLVVPASKIKDVCKTLQMTDQFAFDCLSDLTAVDRKNLFEVIYHLFSYKHKHSVVLKVVIPRENGSLPTLEDLWGCANWLEREVYDLFGITFQGHSDLRRIMMPDDWVGHPLRKDYKEEEDYHGISTTRPPLI